MTKTAKPRQSAGALLLYRCKVLDYGLGTLLIVFRMRETIW
jgi:hypothetical protein